MIKKRCGLQAILIIMICMLFSSFLFNIVSANSFNCWKCGNSYDRAYTANCSKCGWDICPNCGACGCSGSGQIPLEPIHYLGAIGGISITIGIIVLSNRRR